MKIEQTKPQTFSATVDFVKNLAGDYYHGRFRLTEPTLFNFTAGQYVIFNVPAPKLRHTMSIASSPRDLPFLDILQSTKPMGEGSKWFLTLKPGDPVTFLGPVGKFVLAATSHKQKVFVATGCGIAPFRSMIGDYLASGATNPVVLYWGLRYETDLFWQEEFAKLSQKHQIFRFFTTLSKPSGNWQGICGRVTDHVVSKTESLKDSEFYLCGNRQMIAEVRKQLTDAGVPAEQVFTETFF